MDAAMIALVAVVVAVIALVVAIFALIGLSMARGMVSELAREETAADTKGRDTEAWRDQTL